MMESSLQRPIVRCLPYQRIMTSIRRRERFGIAPILLDELEAVLEAALVASEEKTAFVVLCAFGELCSVGDSVSDHAGHFH